MEQSLSDYIARKQERRNPNSKGAALRIPEWRKRAIEQQERSPWRAVTDLTEVA